ncbi:MAG TPA: Rne/Rng family ribonuclease [Jiangellaceae bacterium]|nr:Rne/Rng family ribonuclease [Jiangellaceae bacterium]
MHDESNTDGDAATLISTDAANAKTDKPVRKRPSRRRAASRPAGPPADQNPEASTTDTAPEPVAPARRKARKSARAKTADPASEALAPDETPAPAPATAANIPAAGGLLFQAPEFVEPVPAHRAEPEPYLPDEAADSADEDDDESPRRRRRRGGRGRRKKTDVAGEAHDEAPEDSDEEEHPAKDEDSAAVDEDEQAEAQGATATRRRRRRKRKGDGEFEEIRPDDPPNTVVKVREPRETDDTVTKVTGSTRLEAKKQRRREGREAGRRRAPVISESEFLARREAVERVMAVRQNGDRTQIAVLEDGVLVEHYVSRTSDQPLIGNVYLGRVQNVLPAMEAAFVDIGRGRNAVLYAGEVDWIGLGHTDGPKRIEDVLKSGQTVLVQVTKEPVGHKGARLTGQISLPGRYVVYVPGGSMSGISRKLPENERSRLKKILKQVVPDDAGVIVRTAAEGATEEELTHDVSRLRAQWEEIQKRASGSAPQLLYGEPDLAIKVVRDLFNEDFAKLVVSGDQAWDTIEPYVSYVASSLRDRLERWTGDSDVFAGYRVDEQIAKALERKVWLPSGGSLVIDRTEAMTVIDVNTGKFTGSGGNLEETVTKNNLEAAEEIVRQLRLRDIGGIIVIDFIDMVLEANRDLVLRRLVECLGRDRTKHQVAEVTSLGLVQMTRKRIGSGLLEAFSEPCEHCNGRGLHIHTEPVLGKKLPAVDTRQGRAGRRDRRRRGDKAGEPVEALQPKLEATATPGEASPADLIPVESADRTVPEVAEPATTGAADVTAGETGDADTGPAAAAVDAAPAGAAPESEARAVGRGAAEQAAPATPVSDGTGPVEQPGAGTAEQPGAGTAEQVEAGAAEQAPAPKRRRRRAQRPAGSPDAVEPSPETEPAQV